MTTTRTRRFTAALMTCTALGLSMACALAAPGPARAAETPPATIDRGPAEVAEDARVAFDIAAQPLGAAIDAFIAATGWQVGYTAEVTRDRNSPGATGSLTPTAALTRLLSGTGVTYRLTGARTVALDGPQASGERITLGTVAVEGRGIPRQSEIGNLPPAYAGGQVARGGKLGMLGNRDIMDTPFNQTSYTAKLIQDQQARSIGEALENDPSVRNLQAGGDSIEQWYIRGFRVGNQDVALNGLYGIAPTSGTTMASESLERVEVLKGPSALLNGIQPFNGVGGAINIIPKRAGDEPITQISPSFISNSQMGGHLDIGRRFGADKEFGVRFNSAFRRGGTAIALQDPVRDMVTLGLDYQGDRFRLSSDLGYQYAYDDAPRMQLGLATGVAVPNAPDNNSNYAPSWSFFENEHYYGTLRGEYDLLENLTAFVAVGGKIKENESAPQFFTVQDSQGTISGNARSFNQYEHVVTAQVGLRGSIETGFVKHDLVLTGTGYWREDGQNFVSSTNLASNLYSPAVLSKPDFQLGDLNDAPKTGEQAFTGLAVADTLSILDERVQLTVGLRWQRVVRETFNGTTGLQTSFYDEEAVTPAVGLIVKPWENVSLYGNYIQGLERGSEAPDDADNAGEVFPPTKTEQYEAGVKIDFGRLATTLSVFQISQPNAFKNPDTNVFGVDGLERHRGVELTSFGEITPGIRILGGVTYLDAEQVDTSGGTNEGNRPDNVPDILLNAGIEWDVPQLSGLTLSGRGLYTGSSYVDNGNTQEKDSWMRFDIGARYRLERQNGSPIVFRLNVNNVFDANYWEGLNLSLSTPRTFLLSASFDL
ncbi:MAG TPA: TonB-dependent siderophore receptor [Rhodospirillaceae bacterium]|nr:TonB-dependent siderophore receptor [Rhodospirillaceae bacterium]